MKNIINGTCVGIADVPYYSFDEFSDAIVSEVKSGKRVSAFFGMQSPRCAGTEVFVLLADDEGARILAGRSSIEGDAFPSITPRCPELHLFERELAEQYGLIAEGHPWFKPVRYARSWSTRDAWKRKGTEQLLPAVTNFYKVEGAQIHEVAVGPVHAGVIEPGHFRFQCFGEEVYHLEIALGYQHRGIERALLAGPTPATRHYMETLAGDTTIGHAVSYAEVLEALSGTKCPPRAEALRSVALELERLANHIGDLGALAGDVGYLPTASFNGRIRGELLNCSALLCGSRFGRNFIKAGGVGFDADESRIAELLARLDKNEKDSKESIELLWNTPSVMARFEDTGRISAEQAREMGIVGPAARAAGLNRDIRYTHPTGMYCFRHLPVSTCRTGDVHARAYVRWLEIQQSFAFLRGQLGEMPSGPVLAATSRMQKESIAVALTEGWRGEICHVAITDTEGKLARYKVVDPSFHNWTALALVLRNQEISDFPLCNKSFNLSYCGHDL